MDEFTFCQPERRICVVEWPHTHGGWVDDDLEMASREAAKRLAAALRAANQKQQATGWMAEKRKHANEIHNS